MNATHPWKGTIDFYYGKADEVNCTLGFNYFCHQSNDFKDKTGRSTSNNNGNSPTAPTFCSSL